MNKQPLPSFPKRQIPHNRRLHPLQSFQKSAQDAALAIVAKSPETASSLQASYSKNFPSQSLAATRQQFAATATGLNEPLLQTVNTTMDAVESVMSDLAALTHYVTLTIPQMEDGGNWGVSVQLAALKTVKDSSDKLEKGLEDLSKYASARADALDKCKLESTSKSVTKSESTSASEGTTTEKGDAKSTDKKTSSEEKTVITAAGEGLEVQYRVQAVTAVDVLYYTKAKALYQAALTAYLGAVDFADKNSDKIAAPKGNSGTRGGYSSMY